MSRASLTTLAVRRCDAEAAGAMPAPDVATLSQVTRPGPARRRRRAGRPRCEPAALTSVSFPGCPPGPLILAAAAARNRLWLLKVLRSQVTPLTPRDVDPGGSCIAENRAFKVCSDVHITPASIWAVSDLVRWSR